MSGTYVKTKYPYSARKADELSFGKGVRLELVGVGLEMGWLRCRDDRGYEGLVPHNYVVPVDSGMPSLSQKVALEEKEEVKPRGPKKNLHRRHLSDR